MGHVNAVLANGMWEGGDVCHLLRRWGREGGREKAGGGGREKAGGGAREGGREKTSGGGVGGGGGERSIRKQKQKSGLRILSWNGWGCRVCHNTKCKQSRRDILFKPKKPQEKILS
jgi:hypothetical protein